MHNEEQRLFFKDDNGQYRGQDKQLLRIKVKDGDYIHPKNDGQAELIARLDLGLALNIAEGDAGTGKTFIMFAHALSKELERQQTFGKKAHGEKKKFFLVRPLLEVEEKIGHLPGTIAEKLSPSFQPFFDVLHYFFGDQIQEAKAILGRYIITAGGIEFEISPLAFIRGRNIRNAYMFLDEAQNATVRQMDAFQTRAAEGTQIFVTGDTRQCDLPRGVESGLADLLDILEYAPEATGPEDDIVRVRLTEVERAPIVKRYVAARRARDKAKQAD